MLIIILVLALLMSFLIHIAYVVQYVTKKENKYLNRFIITGGSNMVVAVSLSFVAVFKPDLVHQINLKLLLWLIAGVLMLAMLYIKISIFRKVYIRSQNPENFHYNFFGKKVLHPEIITGQEVMTFWVTVPVFLLAGSYFVARLINIFLYDNI